jgi:hypothetical protein
LHGWLFQTARQLHAHFTPEEICDLFAEITEAEDREIGDAVYNSIRCAWQPGGRKRLKRARSRRGGGYDATLRRTKTPWPSHQPRPLPRSPIPPTWPEPDLEKIEEIVSDGAGVPGLCQRSQFIFFENDPRRFTRWLLRKLFVCTDDPDPYVCLGLNQREFATTRLSEWKKNICELQFVVPSPMTAERGRTKTGYLSDHTLDNTGSRRFLVNECDFSIFARDGKTETRYAPLIRRLAERGITVPDMCASVLLHLANYLPLVMALSSGGKSEHGWFWVEGKPETELRRFMEYAVSLGADHATWTRSQFVRLPDGTRENGKRQLVHHFNLQPLESSRLNWPNWKSNQ